MNDNSLHTSTSHEYYIDLDARIANLADRQAGFSDYVDRRWHDLSVRQLARVLRCHGQTAVRLGRLLRDRCGMGGLGEPPICIDDRILGIGDWGLGIGDWGLGIGEVGRGGLEYNIAGTDGAAARVIEKVLCGRNRMVTGGTGSDAGLARERDIRGVV